MNTFIGILLLISMLSLIIACIGTAKWVIQECEKTNALMHVGFGVTLVGLGIILITGLIAYGLELLNF